MTELLGKNFDFGNKIRSFGRMLGKNYDSREFAEFLKIKFQESKTIVFVIGGAFGFSKDLYSKSVGLISLSRMTFSHQIIRLFFTEQLYRAFTILNNHPYHND